MQSFVGASFTKKSNIGVLPPSMKIGSSRISPSAYPYATPIVKLLLADPNVLLANNIPA